MSHGGGGGGGGHGGGGGGGGHGGGFGGHGHGGHGGHGGHDDGSQDNFPSTGSTSGARGEWEMSWHEVGVHLRRLIDKLTSAVSGRR